MKKIPLRRCVVTKEQLPKIELLRIVKTPTGEVKVDLTGKLNGRGAYIKKDSCVIEKAKDKKILEKVLETTISLELYNQIEDIINNSK